MSRRAQLLALMEELGIEPKKSLGQNFLVSDHVIDKIIDRVQRLRPGSLVEIGPGLGALTMGLHQLQVPLHLIELDRAFVEYWRRQGFTVSDEDALRWRWKELDSQRPRILVSNLPYQISSSLVVDRSLDDAVDGMVLMFQKEVAQKLNARQDQSVYGMLSVLAQTFWDIEFLLEASSGDFLPPPKIASRVLVFQKKASGITNPADFLRFVKACFLHPRKLMLSNLCEGLGRTRADLQPAFESLKIKDKIRAQQLKVQQFVELYRALGYR